MDRDRQKILNEILLDLSVKEPSLYYLSTTEISGAIVNYIKGCNMPKEKMDKVKDLSQEDIQYLLSFDETRTEP